jgi:hypothetical protein
VLIFVDVRVDPKGMSQDELWEAWEEEANAAVAAKEAGTVVRPLQGQRTAARPGNPGCRIPR